MNIEKLPVGLFQANCYIVTLSNNQVYVIDPGGEPEKLISKLTRVDKILLTHAHFDHIGALNALSKAFPKTQILLHSAAVYDKTKILEVISQISTELVPMFNSEDYNLPEKVTRFNDGDKIGPFKVIFTPGHSKGSCCFYDTKDKILFSGDTLMQGSYGRCDLEGGNIDELFSSLEKLRTLPEDTKVFPGHGANTTIKAER